MPPPAVIRGDDGIRRCWWGASSAEYARYHDEEWGRPVTADDALYERLCLEGFQAGLAWITILRKREGFRAAFAGFRIEEVARFGRRDVARLMRDAGIVRNRLKIEAAIENARRSLGLRDELGSLAAFFAQFREGRRPAPRRRGDLPATTPSSLAMSRELKKRGFRFVGPTTVYATMQACGLVNDHLVGCPVRGEVGREQKKAWAAAGSSP
jgi:DNA-3-methyladenine glycosylase I